VLEQGVLGDQHPVNAVRESLLRQVHHLRADEQPAQGPAHLVSELAAFSQHLKGDRQQFSAFLLEEDPDLLLFFRRGVE
jgi:hypothetical protein